MLSCAVAGNAVAERIGEELQDFTGVRMAPGVALGVDVLAVNDDIEDAGAPGHESQVSDHMLVVAEQVVRRAHGAVGIVSRNAVGDRDAMALVRHAVRLVLTSVDYAASP